MLIKKVFNTIAFFLTIVFVIIVFVKGLKKYVVFGIYYVHLTTCVALERTSNPLIGPVSLVLGQWQNQNCQKSTVIGVLELEMTEKWRFQIFRMVCVTHKFGNLPKKQEFCH